MTVEVQGTDGTSIEAFDVQVLAAFKELPLAVRLRAAADAIEALCGREGWDTASFGPGSLRHAADEVEAEDSVAADVQRIALELQVRAAANSKLLVLDHVADDLARAVFDILPSLGYRKGGGQ